MCAAVSIVQSYSVYHNDNGAVIYLIIKTIVLSCIVCQNDKGVVIKRVS